MTKKRTKKEIELKTRMVRLKDKPITSVLVYLFDENFIEFNHLVRVGDRKFCGTVCLQKKTKT